LKGIFILSSLIILIGCTSKIESQPLGDSMQQNHKFSFNNLWRKVVSDPLDILPQNSVSLSKLSTWSQNIILRDAKRTIVDTSDIEPFEKLAHPNGKLINSLFINSIRYS